MKRYKLKRDLPTFNAGETFYLSDAGNLFRESDNVPAYGWTILNKFPNILTDWFEEIKPAEPLIKDEKIRKAVRAWAEVNEYDKLWVYHDNDAISLYNEDDDDNEIIFNTVKKFGLKHLKCYTVEELCGEEEE